MKTFTVSKEFTFYDDSQNREISFNVGDILAFEFLNNRIQILKNNIKYEGHTFDIENYIEPNNPHVQLKYGSREDINYFLSTIPNNNFISLKKEKRNRYLLIYIED